MAGDKAGKPTTSAPIFVGSGPGADYAAEFSLTLLEWLLREEEVSLGGPIEGEISLWIEELFAKPIQVEQHRIPEHDQGAVQRERDERGCCSHGWPTQGIDANHGPNGGHLLGRYATNYGGAQARGHFLNQSTPLRNG